MFVKRIGRKCRLLQIRIEQSNDHARVKHKIRFRSFFKTLWGDKNAGFMFLSEALEEFQKIYILMLVKGLAQINV